MRNKIFAWLVLFLLTSWTSCQATPTYTWNQVLSTNCIGVTGVNKQSLCWDTTIKVMFTCDPASGSTCTSSADWKAGGGGWVDNGTYLAPYVLAHPVAIGSGVPQSGVVLDVFGAMHLGGNLLRCDSSNGCRIDSSNSGATNFNILPSGQVVTAGGYSYTGSNPFGNVTRATDKTSPAVGDYWYNSAYPAFVYWNGSILKRIPTEQIYSNTFTPVTSSNKLLWKAPYNSRIESVNCIVDPGGSSSVVINIQNCNSNGFSCANIDTSSITCGNTNSADDGSLSSPSISAGNWVNLNEGTVTGSPSNLTLTIKYSSLP